MANANSEPSAAVVAEMLKRELEASKSVSDHLAFLRQLAQETQVSSALRDSLLVHIGEEEGEHQAHLGRLLPALEGLVARLESAKAGSPAPSSSPSLTVGDLSAKRPW